MIETRLLHYFLAVARERNITKAAQSLFISQSTLSRQMMDLEDQLGKKLFIRGKRNIELTEDGVFLRNRAQEIMRLMENTETALHSDAKRLSGDVFIGCGETVGMDTIAGLLAEFHKDFPDVKLHTYSGDADAVMDRIDKGLSDMGLLLGPVRQEKYDYLNLHQKDVYGLLMPADCKLAEQDTINIDQLKTLPMILADQTFSGHQDLDWFGEDALNVVATYNLLYNATFLVEHGIGYALCLDRLVNTMGRKLVFRPISPELSVGIYMVTKKYQTFSPAAKVFYERLRDFTTTETSEK